MTATLEWVDKIYVGNHEVTEVYLWYTKIRPEDTAVYTYTLPYWPEPNGMIDVYKPWYTIESVSIEAVSVTQDTWSWASSSVWLLKWTAWQSEVSQDSYQLFLRAWKQWGYEWYVWKYGWVFNFYPQDTAYEEFPSYATTDTNAAAILTFNTTWASVKVWQTKWNWLYQNSWTYTSAESTLVNSILNSNTVKLFLPLQRWSLFTECSVTINYRSNN